MCLGILLIFSKSTWERVKNLEVGCVGNIVVVVWETVGLCGGRMGMRPSIRLGLQA